jgi:uncharacterized protein involved in exopolysaccharide biosynthesis
LDLVKSICAFTIELNLKPIIIPMRPNNDPTLQTANEQADLLDLLLPIAENIKLLVLGPLLVGLCALGISYFLPKTYVSLAILNTPVTTQSTPAEHVAASLMTSAIVLDPVIESLKLRGEGEAIEVAREKLLGDVKAVPGRNDKLVTLTVSARSPEGAQAIANAILKQTYLESRLRKADLLRFTAQLESFKATEKKALTAAASLAQRIESKQTNGGNINELALGYAELLNSASKAQTSAALIEERLQGFSEANLVQPPTLPQKAIKPVKSVVALASILTAFALFLAFVVLRHYMDSTRTNPLASAKLNRIRLAFGLKPKN